MVTIRDNDIELAGNISVGGNIVNKDLTETFDVIRKALDGYAIADGYVEAIRSVFVDATTGIWDYDTVPSPSFRESNLYWQCACLDGSYSSGMYQEFRSKPFQIPMDYVANSGGIIRIHAFCDGAGGNMFFPDINAGGVRASDNTQTLSWFNPGNNNITVSGIQAEEKFVLWEIDMSNGNVSGFPIKTGDIVMVRVQRRAGDANDTATGTLAIMGFEFIYSSNIPKKTF